MGAVHALGRGPQMESAALTEAGLALAHRHSNPH
jgi:hypothetical protein